MPYPKKLEIATGKVSGSLETLPFILQTRGAIPSPSTARVSSVVDQVPAYSVASERLLSTAAIVRSARRFHMT
jgi:hypothetical protein